MLAFVMQTYKKEIVNITDVRLVSEINYQCNAHSRFFAFSPPEHRTPLL